jgi:polysaccharide transporter, PST family
MLRKFINSYKDKKTIFKNFAALSILQGTNFLIPLIIMPYLTIKIGVDGFGLVSFIQAAMVFFTSFTDYGFNVTATREVAINKTDNKKLSEIYSTVMSTKLLLTSISALVLIALIYFIPDLKHNKLAYLFGFSAVIGQVLLPIWFFQGIQEMKYISYLNLAAKIIFTVLIFIFINTPDDFGLVLLFLGLGNIVSGLFGLLWIKNKYNIRYFIPQVSDIKKELYEGWSVFISNFSIVTYLNSNIFILGLFANNSIVGYYSIAEKIITAMRQPLVVFSQAIYPRICELATDSHKKIKNFYRQLFIPFISIFLMASVFVFIFSPEIVNILSKAEDNESSIIILKLLCFVPFIVGLNIPAYQTLLAYKHHKNCSIILTSGSLLNIILNFILAPKFLTYGTAASVIITEIFITIGLYLILKYKHQEHFLFKIK